MEIVKRMLPMTAALVILAFIATFVLHAKSRAAQPHYVTIPATYGDIVSTVNETGTINPVNEVNVGTEVSGTITKLDVDYNSTVKAGQVLAELDPTPFAAADQQAQATLTADRAQAAAQASTARQWEANIAAAVATEQQQRASAQAAQANIAKAQAQLQLDRATVRRDGELLARGYIAQSQVDADTTAVANDAAALRAAQASYAAAEAQAAAAASQVRSVEEQRVAAGYQAAAARAQVQAAGGQVQQAAYNLSRTVIRSPIDGIVVSRAVSVGQTVAASFQTPTLFVIASNLKDMQIDVSVDEADVGNLRVGDSAIITVPAYPNIDFQGTVKQVRVNPTTTNNVVTYDAVVTVHDDSARLLPGMTANVTINVAKHDHVLVVPTSALLYRPAPASGDSSAHGGGRGAIAGAPGSHVTLTVLRNGRPVEVPVVIGLSDDSNVEIASGGLREGDAVVVAALQQQQVRSTSPFGGGPRGGR